MPRKVLIIDDLETHRQILSEMLSSDYDILEASNGEDALDILLHSASTISAVLLDISMPILDGFEVLRRIRANSNIARLPVIMITSSDDEESRIKSLTLGANDYVIKPYNAEFIKHCLSNNIALYEASAAVSLLAIDKLTGIMTREAFFQQAAQEIGTRPPGYFVLGCLDIDGFKIINDQYGSEIGDKVLKELASILQEFCEKNGGICGRIFADRFISLYPASLIQQDLVGPHHIRKLLVERTSINMTLSVGRFFIEDKSLPIDVIYARASIAKDTVKKHSDIHIAVYHESMRHQILREQQIVNEMHSALESRQFEVWFQPQYNHATDAMIGAEALVRWRHPTKGLIPPNDFIPVFEQNGFIYSLDKFVWEEVCRYLKLWTDNKHYPLPVSVNISRYDMLRPDIVETLSGLMEKYQLPINLLRLEITESAFSESPQRIVEVVNELLSIGFTIEIDDFGSGYSSLNTLKDVPAQILKLDMKFLTSSNDSRRGGNIIESIIRMAKWLGMSVIAEGVETLAQANYLVSIGCNYIQGYLYSKPLPAPQYVAHCNGNNKEEHLLKLETVENLDNNAFWDPQSIDTLIFNTYVGAACIYEYCNGRIEVIRATKSFVEMLNSDCMTMEDVLKLDWSSHLDAVNLQLMAENIERSKQTNSDAIAEIIFHNLPGCPTKSHFRSTLRVIATAGNRQLVYNLIYNLTARREAEQRILDTDAQLQFLNDVSRDLLSHSDTDMAIDLVLHKVLEHFGADRAYLFELNSEKNSYSCTYEADAENRESKKAILQNQAVQKFAGWISALSEHRHIYLSNISEMPEEHAIEREALISHGVNSIISAPITRNKQSTDFIALENPSNGLKQIDQLSVLGDYLAVMLTRRDLINKIADDSRNMQILMDDTPGGFALMQLTEQDQLATLYVNDGFCRMRKMTREELLQAEGHDAFANIHQDDKQLILAAMKSAISSGDTCREQLRLRGGDGKYNWFSIFGRMTRGDKGETYLNIYYADLSEQEKKGLTMRETMPFILSAIMNSSPDLAFAKDKDFNFICCSPGFVKFTRQKTEADVIGKNDYDFWTKEEADHFRSDDERLFATGESLIDFTEPIPSDDGIQHYSVTSKYILRDSSGEIIGLYGLGRDITDTRNALDRLQLLTDSIPGGIATYVVSPDSIKISYFNDGFCKLLGCTREEYEVLSSNNNLINSAVFSEDQPLLMEQIDRLVKQGTPIDCTYRCEKFDNSGQIWVNMRGVLSERHNDIVYVNTVFYDVTEQQQKRMQMLDNLPCGAGIYELKNGQMSLVYQNKSYWDIVGLSDEKYPDPAPMSAIHPEDVPIIMQEITAAITQGRDVICDIRLRHLTHGYHHVRVVGRIIPMGNTGLRIFATFTPDENADPSYQQTLPLLLSTIMETSNDFVFAKDKEFRYLCCSPAFLKLARVEDQSAVLGKTDFDLFSTQMAEQFRQNDLALIESGKPFIDINEVISAPDGSHHYCLASKYLLHDAAGVVNGIYGVSRDISTEHNAAEQLRLITDSVPGGIATYTCQNMVLRLTYCNDGFCKLFGGSKKSLQKRSKIDPLDWVFEEDRPELLRQLASLVENNTTIDCLFRIHLMDGGYKWVNQKSVVFDRRDDIVFFNALLLDVTERQNTNEQLRIIEEENSLAIQHGGNLISRFDVAERSLTLSPGDAEIYSLPEKIMNVPYEPVRIGLISPESADKYINFFEAIINGNKAGYVLYQQRYIGSWRWMEAKSSTIFSDNGEPVKAIISFFDVTERLEKEAIYKKWQHSLEDRVSDSYALFRCNLNRNTSYESKEGNLLNFDFAEDGLSFNKKARLYADACVHEEDRDRYIAFTNSDVMIASYYRNKRSDILEYRELLPGKTAYRWLRLSIDLVEYPNSTEIEAYLMYEDIDEAKRAELTTKVLSETDPLTGILNRNTFIKIVAQTITHSGPEARHALLMLDLDGFKLVNDAFGHAAGDQTLIEVANSLSAIMRQEDTVARLGGDEFIIFMSNIHDKQSIAHKARQICSQVRKAFSLEVQTSASIGIAIAPYDGVNFDTLYKKADSALYYVKGSGKDNYAFYTDDMANEHLEPEADVPVADGEKKTLKKRRMLIVDDSELDHDMLQSMFCDEFITENAKDGRNALIRLRHYGSAISVVLLDLMMPGMDGFAVLEKMQECAEMRDIPVIIVSGDDSRETCLMAIRNGAQDFITKPVDKDLLRLRVHSAISKAENERLRAMNNFLEMQNEERCRFEAVLEDTGIAFAEYDLTTGEFIYHQSFSHYLAGTYDKRPLWQVFLSDAVTDQLTVQAIQQLIHKLSVDKTQNEATLIAPFKTPHGDWHNFRISVRRPRNETLFSSRLVITLNDLEYVVPNTK